MILTETDLEIEWEVDGGYLDWVSIFGNNNPVEIEIGIGKGHFLLNTAQNAPNINYLGIEWARKYYRIACERACKRALNNIRFLKAEARQVIEQGIRPESVANYHVYFPDPWTKRRHHKRRIFQHNFVTKIIETLINNGKLYLATDCKEYFEWIIKLMSKNNNIHQILNGEIKRDEGRTHYEVKYLGEGRPIFQGIFQKNI